MALRGALRKKIQEKRQGKEEELNWRKEELKRRREELRQEEEDLRKEKQTRLARKSPDRPAISQVRIIPEEGKLGWLMDIFTAVFIIGVVANSGFIVGGFSQTPNFEIMKTFLLFAALLQLIKIGRKV